MNLIGSKTLENLKQAFASEAKANRRYLYFASYAEMEGFNDVAAIFRATAEAETGHANGLLDFLAEAGDPDTGCPIGSSVDHLKSAIVGETYESVKGYPDMAMVALEEGFSDIAKWFEALAKSEKSHAERFHRALQTLQEKHPQASK